MSFFNKVLNYLGTELLVQKLANNRMFQWFALNTVETVQKVQKDGLSAVEKIAKEGITAIPRPASIQARPAVSQLDLDALISQANQLQAKGDISGAEATFNKAFALSKELELLKKKQDAGFGASLLRELKKDLGIK